MINQQRQLKGVWGIACAIVLILALSLYVTPDQATAHGTAITYSLESTVIITANFDTGEPMSDAQVTVYAPDDLSSVWLSGNADENGVFVFTPDPEMAGNYDVRVRVAGHGEILSVPVGGSSVTQEGSATMVQQLIMAAAIIWGFIGTALYFSNRKKPKAESSEGKLNNAHT